jgi:hypothetical protein
MSAIRNRASSDGSLTCWLASLADGRGVTATRLHRKYAATGRETAGILRLAIRRDVARLFGLALQEDPVRGLLPFQWPGY